MNNLSRAFLFANFIGVCLDLMKPFRFQGRLEYRIRVGGTAPHVLPCNNGLQSTFPFEEIKVCLSDHCAITVSSLCRLLNF
jgi:hypothetical protein